MIPQNKNATFKASTKTNLFLQSTLTLLSVGLSLAVVSRPHADINDTPIVNPTNPAQIITPQAPDTDSASQPNQNEIPAVSATEPAPTEAPSQQRRVSKPTLTQLAKTYHFPATSHKKNKPTDQAESPAVLPTYHFDIDISGDDDIATNTSTGYIFSSVCGSMLFGY
jgi:hypothetical protein